MYVYAVAKKPKQWYIGAKLINRNLKGERLKKRSPFFHISSINLLAFDIAVFIAASDGPP